MDNTEKQLYELFERAAQNTTDGKGNTANVAYTWDQTNTSQADKQSIVTGLLSQTDSLWSNVNSQRTNVANWIQTLYQNQWNKDEAIRAQEYNSAQAQYARLIGLGMSHDSALAAIGAGGTASAATAAGNSSTSVGGINPTDLASTAANVMSQGISSIGNLRENYVAEKELAAADIVGEDANEVYSWREKGITVPDEAKESPEYFKRWTDKYQDLIDPATIKRDKDGNITDFDWFPNAEMDGHTLTDADKLPYMFTHGKNWHDHYLKGRNARWNREQFRKEFAANIDPRGKTVLEREGEHRRQGMVLDNVTKTLDNLVTELSAIQAQLLVGDFNSKGITLLNSNWASDWATSPLNLYRHKEAKAADGTVTTSKVYASHYESTTASGKAAIAEHLALFNEDGSIKSNAPLIMQNWYYELQNSVVQSKAQWDAREDIYTSVAENYALQCITYQTQKAIMQMTSDSVSGLERKMHDSRFLSALMDFHLCCNALNYRPGQYLGGVADEAIKIGGKVAMKGLGLPLK